MKTVKEVICPFCGSLCDDIEVVLDKDEIIEVKNACQLGAVKIMGNKGGKRLYSPLIKRDGEFVEVTY
ncbi:MAG: formylmethanofuran dehydrogenase subunit B, partial [Candidatus Heimdallarchaeota archaeon]